MPFYRNGGTFTNKTPGLITGKIFAPGRMEFFDVGFGCFSFNLARLDRPEQLQRKSR
jgi:hypothetical protein